MYKAKTIKIQDKIDNAIIVVRDFFNILVIFRERGREGEREGEKHQCVVASHVTHTE